MSYTVLARKWRPQQFSDIVGQGHVVRTFINAIKSGRVHQAYLFTGSRGIGKTSIARIFSKALRCENTVTDEHGFKSCDTCANCKEIIAGNSVDVLEVDGASNNGVDQIREIRENAKYLPASGSKKIYIIDEVHMLTTAAFNALLKTLEEPPPHVVFIFATTEPHKIPATILSRCQRFDFRRVTVHQIQTRLAEICTNEGIEAEPTALTLIARSAEGSMRDSLSLLDQVIAYSGKTLTAQNVRDGIGLIGSELLLALLQAVFARDTSKTLSLVQSAYEQGHDLKVLTKGLIEYLHESIVYTALGGANPSSELSTDELQTLGTISPLRSLEEQELIFQVLSHGLEWIARSNQPKVILDILLIKCATAEILGFLGQASSEPLTDTRPQAPVSQASAPAPAAPIISAPAPEKAHEKTPEKKPVSLFPSMSTATAAGAPSTAPKPATLAPEKNPTWEGLIERVRGARPLLASILEHASCGEFPSASHQKDLIVLFKPEDDYYREQLKARVYQEQLGTAIREYLGKPVGIVVESRELGETVAERRAREVEEKRRNALDAAKNHPIIKEAQSLFGGELGPIQIKE